MGKDTLKNIPPKQWAKFIAATILYIAFLCWVRSLWGIIAIPFIFDAYITKKIPWTFWHKWNDGICKTIMSWIDAIVFAAIAVYFVNIYAFQNYMIPSSSMEKSLLVGDYLYVSKLSYGPRKPMTPLSMPLAQHTLPTGGKSYIEWPQWEYERIPGFGKVERGDIVVFNFPAGDTVAVNYQQTDFYSLAYSEGKRLYPNPVDLDSMTPEQQRVVYDIYYNAGRKYIMENPRIFGEILYRPVDRRENYVKRCIALPGDTLQIVDGQVYLNGRKAENPEHLQFNYFVQTTGMEIPDQLMEEWGISKDDRLLMSNDISWEDTFLSMGLTTRVQNGTHLAPVYHFPLTQEMYRTLSSNTKLISKIVMDPESFAGDLYPLNLNTHWDRNNYGPLWIPAKGSTVRLTYDNLPLYERCIVAYEHNHLEVKEDGIYINGEKTDQYTFKMDYYWMMGDNRHNSADSRYWGFVPEDHIVGKPITIWLSLDQDHSWFDGKIRWGRLFKKAK